MFKLDLKNVITNIVDHEIDRSSYTLNSDYTITKEGLSMEILLSASDYDTEKSEHKHFFIMFCGNVSVFYAFKKMSTYYPSQIPCDNWINTSNHDSCWRSDGLHFITDVYFEMCYKVNPEKAPIEIETDVNSYFIWPKKVNITYKWNDDNWKNEIVKVEMV